MSITSTNRNPDATYAILGMISRIVYPTGGYTKFEYEPNDYSMVIKRPFHHDASLSHAPKLFRENGTTSGLRVKSIKSYLSDNTPFLEKTYSYTDSYGSSGILTYIPRYSLSYSAQTAGGVYTGVTESGNLKSSNILSYNSTHIEYRSVTEHIKDSSRIVHTFTHSALTPSYQDKLTLLPSVPEPLLTTDSIVVFWELTNTNYSPPRVHSAVAPLTSYQSVRGMPVDRVVYVNENSNKPLSWEHTEYLTSDSTLMSYLPCYLVRKFALYGTLIGRYPVKSSTTKSYSQNSGISTTDSLCYVYNSK